MKQRGMSVIPKMIRAYNTYIQHHQESSNNTMVDCTIQWTDLVGFFLKLEGKGMTVRYSSFSERNQVVLGKHGEQGGLRLAA